MTYYVLVALITMLVGVAEAGMDVTCTVVNGQCAEFSTQKKVITDYEDFLQIIAKVEHSEKLKNQAMAEKGVLLKLKDEQGTIIKVQADQIKACESIVQQQEKLGATQEQLSQAVEAELRIVKRELEYQKDNRKWWAGSGFAVGALVGMVIMAVMN